MMARRPPRRRSKALTLAVLFATALCGFAMETRAGNVTTQPSGSGSPWTWTWPSSAGSNGYFLQTDGTGVTTWAPASVSSLALSSLTSATTTNSIDNTNEAQTWGWSTLAGNTALTLTTSMTTGTLLSLTNTNTASSAGIVLNISNSETNAASYGIKSVSATTGSGYGIYSGLTGANTGYALYATNADTSHGSYGIYGTSASSSGYGVYGNNSSTGFAGYFNGKVTVNGALTVSSGNINIATSTDALQLGGTTILTYPDSGNDTSSWADGPTSLVSETTTGEHNTAVGVGGLNQNTSGVNNTGVGNDVLYNNLSGNSNTGVGAAVLYANTTGSSNTAVGYNSLNSTVTGGYNTAIGAGALLSVTGTGNIGIGYQAGSTGTNNITTGSDNVLIGENTAANAATDNNEIVIGAGVTGDGSNSLNIGNAIFATGMTGSKASPAGSVGIGTTSPQASLDVSGGARVGNDTASCSSTNQGEVKYTSNTFYGCNGTSWIPMDSGMHFISTQTASSSAALQFSGSNWSSSYNTLFLDCAGLVQSATGGIPMRVGEGATPTWEAGTNYTYGAEYSCSGVDGGGVSGGTTHTDLLGLSGSGASAGTITSLKAYIDNVGSSSLYKFVTFTYEQGSSGKEFCWNTGSSYWNADTNPITGIEIVPTSGTITSGTCSLYGMN